MYVIVSVFFSIDYDIDYKHEFIYDIKNAKPPQMYSLF